MLAGESLMHACMCPLPLPKYKCKWVLQGVRTWLLCREDEEERYTFSSRLVGQTTPKRTTSLDSPGKGSAREWEDKGPRSGGERRTDNGPARRGPDVNRPGAARVSIQSATHLLTMVCCIHDYLCMHVMGLASCMLAFGGLESHQDHHKDAR